MEKGFLDSNVQHFDSASAMQDFAANFARSLSGDVLCLQGDLGAGKTTFTQGILKALGASSPFVSPTFLIMKQYDLSTGSPGHDQGILRVYHVDAYRTTGSDMLELGWQEIIADPHALIVVEWPEKIVEALPENAQYLQFAHVDGDVRSLTFKKE